MLRLGVFNELQLDRLGCERLRKRVSSCTANTSLCSDKRARTRRWNFTGKAGLMLVTLAGYYVHITVVPSIVPTFILRQVTKSM
jgi:hypothetical protein